MPNTNVRDYFNMLVDEGDFVVFYKFDKFFIGKVISIQSDSFDSTLSLHVMVGSKEPLIYLVYSEDKNFIKITEDQIISYTLSH